MNSKPQKTPDDYLRWGESIRESVDGGRERLLDAALFCYRRFGPKKASAADIAVQARVTRPTLYRYFRYSHELLQATIQRELIRLWGEAIEQVQPQVDSTTATAEALVIVTRRLAGPDYHFLTDPAAQGAVAAALLNSDRLAGAAQALGPLVHRSPTRSLRTLTLLFETLNRMALSYAAIPSHFFHSDDQLFEVFLKTVQPMTGGVLEMDLDPPDALFATIVPGKSGQLPPAGIEEHLC